MTTQGYHYTESGLDYIWLANGYRFVNGPGGRHVVIEDVEGLQQAIGKMLVENKKDLTGKEVRFLRHEMLMSQPTLAKLLEVDVQTVARWEKGVTKVPKPAEALIRLLYREHTRRDPDGGPTKIRGLLEAIANLEDEMDGILTLRRSKHENWRVATSVAA